MNSGPLSPRLLPSLFPLLMAACTEAPEAPPLPPDPLPIEEAERARALGAPAASALAKGLVSRLGQAIEEEGLEGATAFCIEAAIPLTQEIQVAREDGLMLKRATLRWRNPANAPDEWEERVLRYLEAMEDFDPEGIPGELTASGPGGTLRYYRTLRIAPMCLSCHGNEGDMDSGVLGLLREHYPDDRATGYGPGELRGVIRVEVPQG